VLRNGMGAEVSVIGKEGLVGFAAMLELSRIPARVVVQLPGAAYRIDAAVLMAARRQNPTLDLQLHRFLGELWVQATQTVVCNRLHGLEQRLAKWLMLAHDRSNFSVLTVTHELLAQMLGANRSSVSSAAFTLEKHGLIRYARGRIKITDPEGLRKTTCECYEVCRRALESLLKIS
jgi:CRP-like cAMP-binding protein